MPSGLEVVVWFQDSRWQFGILLEPMGHSRMLASAMLDPAVGTVQGNLRACNRHKKLPIEALSDLFEDLKSTGWPAVCALRDSRCKALSSCPLQYQISEYFWYMHPVCASQLLRVIPVCCLSLINSPSALWYPSHYLSKYRASRSCTKHTHGRKDYK